MKLFINILFISFLTSTAGFSQDCKSRLVIETDLILVEIFINDSLVATSRYYETELDSG